uniref:Uncharacterized protein n=1 Tax=Romanomermis culicivorax TaxID=13658 RepID=A0A915JGD7_ROMCU
MLSGRELEEEKSNIYIYNIAQFTVKRDVNFEFQIALKKKSKHNNVRIVTKLRFTNTKFKSNFLDLFKN